MHRVMCLTAALHRVMCLTAALHRVMCLIPALHPPAATCGCMLPSYNKLITPHIYKNILTYQLFFTRLS